MKPLLYNVATITCVAIVLAVIYTVYNIPYCPTEDSSWCYWDASTQGNHEGRSFWQLGNITFYLLP